VGRGNCPKRVQERYGGKTGNWVRNGVRVISFRNQIGAEIPERAQRLVPRGIAEETGKR